MLAMDVVIASCSLMPPGFGDDPKLLAALSERGVEAQIRAWDDDSVDWSQPKLVAVRSTWDYTFMRDAFLVWTQRIGGRLHNSHELVAWNSDKRYLADLADLGLPTVETQFVSPGASWVLPNGEVVVKPTVSAGARDTGRFAPDHHGKATDLVEAITSSGRTAMVQPFQASVDSEGETALVFIDGEFSHSLRKRAVLSPDEVAPLSDEGPKAAKAMYEPDLVGPAEAADDQLALAKRLLAEVEARFSYRPLYGRVDLLRGDDGAPVLLELEMVEPNLYFQHAPEAAGRLADAIALRLRA
ncbi:hypothetical protein BH10ACT11_BH10ACT11_15070 [soil metagenome]